MNATNTAPATHALLLPVPDAATPTVFVAFLGSREACVDAAAGMLNPGAPYCVRAADAYPDAAPGKFYPVITPPGVVVMHRPV